MAQVTTVQRRTPPRPAPSSGPDAPPPRRRLYLRLRTRAALTVACALAWLAVSTWLALPWAGDLGRHIGAPLAWVVIAGIALVPGYLNAQLLSSVLLDRARPLAVPATLPDLAVLVAAYNEEASIGETIAYLARSDYPGSVEFVVVDDGSADGTRDVVREWMGRDDRVRLVAAHHGGKAHALNVALRSVRAPLVATIDADTLITPQALTRVVTRLESMPGPSRCETAGRACSPASSSGTT